MATKLYTKRATRDPKNTLQLSDSFLVEHSNHWLIGSLISSGNIVPKAQGVTMLTTSVKWWKDLLDNLPTNDEIQSLRNIGQMEEANDE